MRFNDLAHLEELMDAHGGHDGCHLLEPILGHILEPADPDFIRGALRLAHEHDALLILDETITSRLYVGGWQTEHGIEPDLTTLGKTIGGGMPVGAFGGKEHVMRILDPRADDALAAHGTMNGSPLCMAAGCASLDLLDAAGHRAHQRHGRSPGARARRDRAARPACACTITAPCSR